MKHKVSAVVLSSWVAASAHAQPAPADPPAEPTPKVAAALEEPAPAPTSTPAAPAPVVDAAMVKAVVAEQLEKQPKLVGWKEGFFIQTADKASKLKIGGFLQFDGRFFLADADDPHTDQMVFKSLRPDLSGTVFEHFDFRILPDFASSRFTIQDAYVDIRYTDKFKIRAGKFKVPFGLERLQGETNTTFIERGLPTQLTPNRDLGVQAFGELGGGLVSYQVGVFNGVADAATGDGDSSNDKEVAARVFIKPFANGGKLVKELGVGGAVTYGKLAGTLAAPDMPSFRTVGQTTFFSYRTGMTLADTVVADGVHWRASAQGHYFAGPVGLMGEYVRSVQNASLGETSAEVTFDAWQAMGQWVLTGEDASYKSVTPSKAFDPKKGKLGAVSLEARYGELRIIDGTAIKAGFVDPTKSSRHTRSAGAGVDWFMNRSFRLALNLERTWYTQGAKEDTTAVDRTPETSLVGRVQTVF